jgi:hypothetical protein
MSTQTLGALADEHNVTLEPQLARDLEIPVLTGPQVQGDVIILPTRAGKTTGAPIPAGGVPVVRGENGGNTHLLVGAGTWHPTAPTRAGTDLGTLTVPDGSEAFMLHPEHGANAMGPGTYLLRRQREQADEIRQVAD